MGYNHIAAFQDPPPLTKEAVIFFMDLAAHRFLTEFPHLFGAESSTDLDEAARTVTVKAGGEVRVYSFDALA